MHVDRQRMAHRRTAAVVEAHRQAVRLGRLSADARTTAEEVFLLRAARARRRRRQPRARSSSKNSKRCPTSREIMDIVRCERSASDDGKRLQGRRRRRRHQQQPGRARTLGGTRPPAGAESAARICSRPSPSARRAWKPPAPPRRNSACRTPTTASSACSQNGPRSTSCASACAPRCITQVVMAALARRQARLLRAPARHHDAQAQDMFELARSARACAPSSATNTTTSPPRCRWQRWCAHGYIGKPLTFNITYFVSQLHRAAAVAPAVAVRGGRRAAIPATAAATASSA